MRSSSPEGRNALITELVKRRLYPNGAPESTFVHSVYCVEHDLWTEGYECVKCETGSRPA